MALVLADRVKVSTTTTGTGTYTLGSAATGYQDFSVIGNANTTFYTVTDNINWEVGIGTYTASGTTLSRNTILSSSNAGSAVNWSAGTKEVFVTYPSSKSVIEGGSPTFAGLTVTGVSQTKKTNLVASGSGWDDGLNLYSADGVNRWNVLVDDGASDSFRIAYNNSEALQINTSRNITATVDLRAPIFYDSNNTAFYGDFNSVSSLSSLNLGGNVSSNTPYNNPTGEVLRFGGYSADGYVIGTNLENVGGNYTKLDFRWHTGIRMGAQPSYGGVRFFNNEDFGSVVFQINGVSNYTYKYTWMYTNTNGIYSDTNSAHFYPNNGSYGSWRMDGSRNGWVGLEFSTNVSLMMNSDTYGFHNNAVGWRLYNPGGSLYIPGEIQAYWSDERLKENIEPLTSENGIKILEKLVPSKFRWKESAKEYNDCIPAGEEEIGLIAQQVQRVIPGAVKENKAGVNASGKGEAYLTINYNRIAPFIIQAVKDLSAEVAALKEKVHGTH